MKRKVYQQLMKSRSDERKLFSTLEKNCPDRISAEESSLLQTTAAGVRALSLRSPVLAPKQILQPNQVMANNARKLKAKNAKSQICSQLLQANPHDFKLSKKSKGALCSFEKRFLLFLL